MRFVSRSEIVPRFKAKRVAIVGSGPGCIANPPGFIDAHDVVVRINNYKLSVPTGFRADVFYSFFGTSIRKSADELKHDGVTLCMCKCPNAHAIQSDWHRRKGQMIGVDYRPHYNRRKGWWFCDTYIPEIEDFLRWFNLLGRHIPTTGFAAILDVLSFGPSSVHLTGFDFFHSGMHNVDEKWCRRNPDDPIQHVPDRELAWLRANAKSHVLSFDKDLAALMCDAE